MPKKRDPLSDVVRYFVVQDLAQVQETLSVVKEIVRSREGAHPRSVLRPTAPAPRPAKKPAAATEVSA